MENTRGINAGEGIYNSPQTSTDGWKYSTPKLLEVMVAPKCNKADSDCYMRKPTDPPWVGPKAGKLLGLCEERRYFLGTNFLCER